MSMPKRRAAADLLLLYTQPMLRRVFFTLLILTFSGACFAQLGGDFPALEQWHMAILRGDSGDLTSLYSVSPPAEISTRSGKVDAAADVAFWTGLKPASMNISVVKSTSPQPGIHGVLFQASVKSHAKMLYVTAEQIWQQQGPVWRLIAEERDIAKLEQPLSVNEHIYPEGDAHAEVREALTKAAKDRKRVLVVFGADWCYDCHVLDKAFQRADIAPVLRAHYEVVHVDVGRGEKNQDLMQEYGVPMKKGIPGIAVLDSSGKVLYSQKNGEWERARALGPEDLLALLNKWKGGA